MNKRAATTGQIIKALALATGGATAGGLSGYYVTPHIAGYQDVPEARRLSATMNAIMGALYAGAAPSIFRKMQAVGGPGPFFEKHFKQIKPYVLTSIGSEFIPVGVGALTRMRQAAGAQEQAAETSSIPEAIRRTIMSPVGRGVGAGAALSGLAGIVSGLSRRQSNEEFKRRTGRGTMVTTDTLKYLLPMMMAGGMLGSIARQREQQAGQQQQTPGITNVAA